MAENTEEKTKAEKKKGKLATKNMKFSHPSAEGGFLIIKIGDEVPKLISKDPRYKLTIENNFK